VRALHDPARTADGYLSSSWRPVSPVFGQLDAVVWQTTAVAALHSDKNPTVEPPPFVEATLAPPAPLQRAGDRRGLVRGMARRASSPAAAPPVDTAAVDALSPGSRLLRRGRQIRRLGARSGGGRAHRGAGEIHGRTPVNAPDRIAN